LLGRGILKLVVLNRPKDVFVKPMLDQESIEQQRQILAVHRRTLAHLLTQQATLTSAYTPPGVMQGIDEARENIRRIKTILRVDEPPLSPQVRKLLREERLQRPKLASPDAALSGLDSSTPEEEFWKWFSENSTKLSEFALDPELLPSDDDPMIQELNMAFGKVAEGLTFELSGQWILAENLLSALMVTESFSQQFFDSLTPHLYYLDGSSWLSAKVRIHTSRLRLVA
jgi:hypothetical protein